MELYDFIVYLQSFLKLRDYMLIINVKEEESIDRALKRYKRKFQRTGILKELRRRKNFTKPSVKRRNEILNAAYRQKMYGDGS